MGGKSEEFLTSIIFFFPFRDSISKNYLLIKDIAYNFDSILYNSIKLD